MNATFVGYDMLHVFLHEFMYLEIQLWWANWVSPKLVKMGLVQFTTITGCSPIYIYRRKIVEVPLYGIEIVDTHYFPPL